MSSNQSTVWMSLSDMMTGLMLIFLLISILTISQVILRQEQRQKIVEDFEASKIEIYQDLEEAFGDKKDEWGIEITEDLVVKFHNPDLIFEADSSIIIGDYSDILNEFAPLYLSIINDEKYSDTIKEVRIEGHSAYFSYYHPTYLSLISLSQDRANSVLEYIRETSAFRLLLDEDQEKLTFWMSANGLGNGRALDENGEYVYITKNPVSASSRRVEFRIVTNSEELIQKIIEDDLR